MINRSINNVDMVVVGGGMIGAATALGFVQSGFSVALIEHVSPEIFTYGVMPHVRVSAINHASMLLLDKLGVWRIINAMRATPYRRLTTWEWPQFSLHFDASSIGLEQLGFMVENHVIQQAILQKLQDYSDNFICYCPDTVTLMQADAQGWQLTLQSGEQLQTKLVIGADGIHSQVRKWAGIGVSGWQYRQHCLLMTVKTEQPATDETWQQFYSTGPRAFLPLNEGFASLVWYDLPEKTQQLQSLSLMELTQQVHQHFPQQLGKVEVLQQASFPLTRQHAQHYIGHHLLLLGDAVHTIHPLAGQGVNLGYRDVEACLSLLNSARQQGEQWWSESVLKRYQQQRRYDNMMMQTGMDLLYGVFGRSAKPIELMRNLFFVAVNQSGILKQWMLKYAIGLPIMEEK